MRKIEKNNYWRNSKMREDRKIAHGPKLKKNITSSRWRHETSHNFSLENGQFPYKPWKNTKIRIWEVQKSPQIETLIVTS